MKNLLHPILNLKIILYRFVIKSFDKIGNWLFMHKPNIWSSLKLWKKTIKLGNSLDRLLQIRARKTTDIEQAERIFKKNKNILKKLSTKEVRQEHINIEIIKEDFKNYRLEEVYQK